MDVQPNQISIQILRKELYQNARSVYSPRGGGANGHLAVVMTPADYLVRAGVAFLPPQHPGVAPVHVVGASQFVIAETNRQFKQDTDDHSLYLLVINELRQQVLTTVNKRYLSVLEDPIYGFSDRTLQEILAHLTTTYGTIKQSDIEANREKLLAPWKMEDPIESLWDRIDVAQRFATQAGQPLPDESAIYLTLEVLTKTGVLPLAIRDWKKKATADKTLANFKLHFTSEIEEYNLQLTARSTGYHGAHGAIINPPVPNEPATTNPDHAAAATFLPAPAHITTNGVEFYYCWTHGLGKNRAHTSATCNNKSEGHQETATADKMLGGNDRIMKPRPPGGQGGRGGGRGGRNPTGRGEPGTRRTAPDGS
jgi:hypothetical protein